MEQSKYSSLPERAITSALLVIIISFAVLNGPDGVLFLMLVINTLALREYQQLMYRLGYSLQKVTGQIIGLLLIFLTWSTICKINSLPSLLLLIPFLTFLPFIELFRKKTTPFQNIALTLLGIIWISLPLATFACIGFLPVSDLIFHPFLILGYFVILWLGDTGAYFAGLLAGRHSLFKRISPKKTLEGSIGGLLMALLAGYLNATFFSVLSLSQWLLLSLIINITGSLGDLTKSMLKRSIGVKDSGTILPGHGGVLDRFDSLIGSAPFAFIYLFFYA